MFVTGGRTHTRPSELSHASATGSHLAFTPSEMAVRSLVVTGVVVEVGVDVLLRVPLSLTGVAAELEPGLALELVEGVEVEVAVDVVVEVAVDVAVEVEVGVEVAVEVEVEVEVEVLVTLDPQCIDFNPKFTPKGFCKSSSLAGHFAYAAFKLVSRTLPPGS